MYNILLRVVGRWAPIVTLPVAVVLGFIGYTLESNLSSRYTIQDKSVNEERIERLLSTSGEVKPEKVDHGKLNNTIFYKNDPTNLKG